MHECRSCYYQEIDFFGRICKHKRSMDGTEAEAEYDFCNDVTDCKYYTPYEKMADTYEITKITDLKGNDKTYDRYPLRIGRICKEPKIINNRLFIYYLKNADSSDYSGKILFTSYIQCFKKEKNEIIVTTEHSIYHFRRRFNEN